jgi:hypothetical protein
MNVQQLRSGKSESVTIDSVRSHASAFIKFITRAARLHVTAGVRHNWSIILKIVLVALLGLVVISLFSGLFFVYKDKGNSKRAVNALTLRIALSILIIVIVIASYFLGLLPPK